MDENIFGPIFAYLFKTKTFWTNLLLNWGRTSWHQNWCSYYVVEYFMTLHNISAFQPIIGWNKIELHWGQNPLICLLLLLLYHIWHWNYHVKVVTTPTQPQLNSTVGFDTKMTLIHHHPPTQTQCQQYLSCHWPNFNQTLNEGFSDQQQQQQQ